MSGEYLGRASTRFPPTDFIKMSACELAFAGGLFLWALGKLYLSNLTRLSVNQRNFHERHARHAAKTIGNAACNNTN